MRKKRKKIGKISCESANKTIITKELWPIYSIPTRTRYYSSVFYNGVFLFGGGVGWFVCILGAGGVLIFVFPLPFFRFIVCVAFLLFRICNGFLVVLTFATSFDGCGNLLLQFGKFWVEIINACVGM